MKQALALILTLLVSASLVSPVLAADRPTRTTSTILAERMSNLKTRADFEIERRIGSLNELSTTVGAMKRLSDNQKSEYVSQLEVESSSLYNLKQLIDAETDFDKLKTDVQSILSSYRIYAVYLPKIRLLAGADAMAVSADRLHELGTKLQTRITALKNTGVDTKDLETLVNDLSAKVADAQTQYSAIISTVNTLTPEGYPDNKSVIEEARGFLKLGAEDLKAARTDARKAIDSLKAVATTKTE